MFFSHHSSGIAPKTNCTEYAEENADLSCPCLTPDNFQGTASLSWPGHSDTGLLTVTSVHREDNGTRYTCQMVAGGTTTSTVYTLKVACKYVNPPADDLSFYLILTFHPYNSGFVKANQFDISNRSKGVTESCSSCNNA